MIEGTAICRSLGAFVNPQCEQQRAFAAAKCRVFPYRPILTVCCQKKRPLKLGQIAGQQSQADNDAGVAWLPMTRLGELR